MRKDYWLIAGLAALLFLPFLGNVHLFDWDEINFAECAREMLLTGDWFRPQVNFEPFWEKPPLFLWMQASAMSLFGVNEFSARLPNALCGIATLLLVYRIGTRLHDRMFGGLWVLAWLGSILPHLYFRSGIIDPWFNFFIFCGIYGFIDFRWSAFTHKRDADFWVRYRSLLLGGTLLGLAILTKGPVAGLIALLVLGIYRAKFSNKAKGYGRHLVIFFAAASVPFALWLLSDIVLHGPWFIREFIVYQFRLLTTSDAGHTGFLGYHAVVLLLGCFPISVFALPNLWGDRESQEECLESSTLHSCMRCDFATWMQILFWVVFVLFSLVRTKIVHYSSLAYFPLTYLGTVTLWRAIRWQVRPRITSIFMPTIAVLIGAVVVAIPYLGHHIELLRPLFTRDTFALANLDAHVDWKWWHSIPGVVIAVAGVAAWWWWKTGKTGQAALTVLLGGGIFTSSVLLLFTRNIECYSQGAAIEFYKNHADERCFIHPVGYKSYAHLFYAQKMPVTCDPRPDLYQTIAHGRPDRKIYFVAKINRLEEIPHLSHCRELYRKNGFVFFERE